MRHLLQQMATLRYFITCCMLCLMLNSVMGQELTSSEKKMILIFKFAENIEWMHEDEIDTFNIGIISDNNKFVADLRIFETVQLKNKAISLHRFYNVSDLNNIHILVLTDDKNYLVERIANQIDGKQILLITDGYKKQDLVMINFTYSKDDKIEFEVNKANIIKENMSVKPELLLLGGSEVDIAELYKDSQRALSEIRQEVHDLEKKYKSQQSELERRNILLQEKTTEIEKRNEEITQQKEELLSLNQKIAFQDNKLEQDLNKLRLLQNQLNDKIKEIDSSNVVLDKLNSEIHNKQNKIDSQEKRIVIYETTVDQQKTIIYLAIASLALVMVIVLIVYRGFINKKRTAQKLEEKEAEIRMLFDIAPLPVVMTDLDTARAIYINQLGTDLFKLNSKNALKYMSSRDYYVNPNQREEIIDRLKKEKRINNVEVLLKDSEENQFYGSLSGLITTYEKRSVVFLAIKDITDIKNAVNELNRYKLHLEDLVKERSQELVESQKRFKEMAEMLPETIFEMNKFGQISFVNNRGLQMFGYSPHDLTNGLSIYQVISEYEKHNARELIEKLLTGKELQTTEFRFQRKDGRYFPGIMYINCSEDEMNNPIIRCIVVDITERKSLERKILNTIIQTEEKERKRFAEDLHDGLGSLLSSLNLYVDMADNPNLPEKERSKLFTTLRNIIDESIKNSKEISNNLRPSTLSRFGLIDSLQSFCNKINNTKKVNILFDHSGFSAKLDDNTENALYRIVNELINNTLKYASAKNVWIQMEQQNGLLSLLYRDDGIGFDKQKALQSDGMGLKNIHTRVSSIEGTCEINTAQGKGIEVAISVNT